MLSLYIIQKHFFVLLFQRICPCYYCLSTYRLNRLSYSCMPFQLFPYITPMDHGQVCCCRQSSFLIHRHKITAQVMAKLCGSMYKTGQDFPVTTIAAAAAAAAAATITVIVTAKNSNNSNNIDNNNNSVIQLVTLCTLKHQNLVCHGFNLLLWPVLINCYQPSLHRGRGP